MDLQTIRENLRQKKYQSREEFLADVNQIVENSTLYNGAKSALTVAARWEKVKNFPLPPSPLTILLTSLFNFCPPSPPFPLQENA